MDLATLYAPDVSSRGNSLSGCMTIPLSLTASSTRPGILRRLASFFGRHTTPPSMTSQWNVDRACGTWSNLIELWYPAHCACLIPLSRLRPLPHKPTPRPKRGKNNDSGRSLGRWSQTKTCLPTYQYRQRDTFNVSYIPAWGQHPLSPSAAVAYDPEIPLYLTLPGLRRLPRK